ncbi:TonB-dependent receptor [Sphingomonas sp. BGYR3]|uniref:TonB-dependent receptor plug domain-containing protein n=1 Tax=Sphingomonas sp. BGYR3 TaxID=2975483 RepID=UPI0021A5E971|nr:TonB-dependent receptor [Sphingomonas sp. BGYR3]MDG5489847.1 TonB-dependent receptor [Sphingomonas sp. BGYR3]
MRVAFLKSTISLFVLTIAGTAHAQEQVTEDGASPVIVVTANRGAQPIDRVGQSVTVIDDAELTRRQTQTVADVLRTVPGVSIVRNGGVGASTGVFIRGADSDQTVALIDGVKLNDPSSPGGGFNFGNLLVGNIERIEVLRGPSSVLWGSQAIGGVVNMITRAPTEALTVNARGEYGWRDTGQVVGNIAGKLGPLSASAGGGWFRTDGLSAFSEARGSTELDGYENLGANANLNLALAEGVSVDARGWYSDGRVNIDGFAPPAFAFGDVNEQARTREFVGYTGLNAALFEGRFRNRLGYAYTDTRRRNISLDEPETETFAAHGRNERFEYQGVLDIATGLQATAGAERETSRYSTSSYGAPATVGRARIDSVYGQIVASPVGGLTLTGGVRHDDHNRFGGATTFGGSGVVVVAETGTTIRASYAEGFKAPSLFQLQSDFGNQLLRPERSKGWDAGVTQSLVEGALQASATYFKRDSTDLIAFISCTAPLTGICANRPSGTYDNVARARAEGVEIGVTMQPVEALRFQANYTYTDATNRSPGDANFGRQLVRRPQHSVTALIDYRWSFGLETGATVTHVGSTFDNASNSRVVEGYVLADLRAAMPVTERIEVYGRVENLFDERYETVFRYGTPGRAGYVGVRLSY